MTNEIILRRVREPFDEPRGKNFVVVLKGVPLSLVDEHADLDAAAKDPLEYFFRLKAGGRKFLSHEEFLLLSAFVTAQYDAVYVLTNNLFVEQFPIEQNFSDATKKILLEHFSEPEVDIEPADENLGNAAKLVDIFVGLSEEKFLFGVYNDEQILSEPKVTVKNLFAPADVELAEVAANAAENFFDLQDETDLVGFVREIIFSKPTKIFVRTSNYIGDKAKLDSRLKILQRYFSAQTKIFRVRPEQFRLGFKHRDEYTKILQRHWGHDAFRTFKVYDREKLDAGEKFVRDVSQEQIIADIVEQVELCRRGESFRDVFVTAPTGAGKSVIFQIPAIYLAERHELLTIVISPLIGLMNDQVKNLQLKNYSQARTINSDLSPIQKEQIVDEVAAGECNILYISPETLLSRSDLEQLIGERTVGTVVIDEAHIVTTWGKQFRPDYWYLGDHIRKLRKVQRDRKGHSFVIATFTATAIFRGKEDMFEETVNSLHMLDPITYLGYVKRGDIDIDIDRRPITTGERAEYELPKFTEISNAVKRAAFCNKKTLIYFPEVRLIEEAKMTLQHRGEFGTVATYHGQMDKADKRENYEKFLRGEKLTMLATKAFGMGIDINDIEIVLHFAPTGNVCDYVQEIGRAARRTNLRGEASYHYDAADFKYIKRLHGMSAIRRGQLIAAVEKIYELWQRSRKSNLLLDAENFTYIFDRYADEATAVNKVKTALLIIQKDFEARLNFSPLTVRPIPLFATGFFVMSPSLQKNLRRDYGNCFAELEPTLHVCRVNLRTIWEKNFRDKSFPQFKYLLYSKSPDLSFNQKFPLQPALCAAIDFADDFDATFRKIFDNLQKIIKAAVVDDKYLSVKALTDELAAAAKISKYRAENICEVFVASLESYRKNFYRGAAPLFAKKTLSNGQVSYRFNTAINSWFKWLEKIFSVIKAETVDGQLYVTNAASTRAKEINTVLGVTEAAGVLSFSMTGGANSQLYIHINQIRNLKKIIDDRAGYENKILRSVAERHKISVAMLTYIYENDFDSEKIWDLLEDYFLGKIPDDVLRAL